MKKEETGTTDTRKDQAPRATPQELILVILEQDEISHHQLGQAAGLSWGYISRLLKGPRKGSVRKELIDCGFAIFEKILLATGRDWDWVHAYNRKRWREWQKEQEINERMEARGNSKLSGNGK
jgi:hypothetical protein